jgi:antirestriction protein ArdC
VKQLVKEFQLMAKLATDKFQLITDKLISLISQGVKPWAKPWHSTPYQNLITGHQYTGINPILCTIDMILYNYQSPYFISFNQAKELNWKIKKGSKSTWIRWGGVNGKETLDEFTGETKKEFYSAFKWFNLFNLDCLDDNSSQFKIEDYIGDRIKGETQSYLNPEARLEAVENFIKQHNPTTQFGGNKALYYPVSDTIRLPHYQDFKSAVGYYATYLHELIHWTGHNSRCDRIKDAALRDRPLTSQFGSENYAFEELVAEIGSAMLCNQLGLESELENHASYLDSWLSILTDDKQAFFKASQLATKAVKFLLEIS